jgi:hypothetical protein
MKKTILQTIADLLEAAGVPVLGIDTYPPNEEGEINVSLRVRPAVNSGVDVDAFIADEEKAAPVGESPCSTCTDPDCENCPIKNGDPIKLYTPEQAKNRMMAGYILLTKEGYHAAYWPDKGFVFYKDSKPFALTDFTGLYRKRANHVSDPVNPENTYTPEESREAMKTGLMLRDRKGRRYFFGRWIEKIKDTEQKIDHGIAFWFQIPGDNKCHMIIDFPPDLYSDGTYYFDPTGPLMPEQAIVAMVVHRKKLKNRRGELAWYSEHEGFVIQDQRTGAANFITDFNGLYPAEEGV